MFNFKNYIIKRSGRSAIVPVIALCLMIIFVLSCTRGSEHHSRPNFIVILTDDQQYDAAGFTGNQVIQTPNMDRMASQAMNFSEAHVAFSLCSPSRAAILTGRYGTTNGVLELGSSLNAGEQSFANLMKDKGYNTAQFGKWHIGQPPKALGFDTYEYFTGNGTYYGRRYINEKDTIYPEIHCDEYAVDRTIDFLNSAVTKEDPFLVFLCSQTPHMNGELVWDARESTKARYEVKNMPVPLNRLDSLKTKPDYLQSVRNRTQAMKYGYPDSLAIQEHTRDYYSVITELDGFLGRLFQKVEELQLLENTYIIFMSDNGWMLGDHGFTSKVLPYQPSTHVPFWVMGPGIKPDTSSALVTNLDIFPTLLSLADVPLPENLHGQNLAHSLLSSGSEPTRDYLIYEGLGTYGGGKHNISVIGPTYRYIETYTDKSLNEISFQELYNRKSDPLEMNNLAMSANDEIAMAEFQKHIRAFKKNTITHRKNQNEN